MRALLVSLCLACSVAGTPNPDGSGPDGGAGELELERAQVDSVKDPPADVAEAPQEAPGDVGDVAGEAKPDAPPLCGMMHAQPCSAEPPCSRCVPGGLYECKCISGKWACVYYGTPCEDGGAGG